MHIIKDTREKTGWNFTFHEDVEMSVATIKYGDYTTEKLKDKVRIERKASTAEIALNLGKKTNKDRFFRELEALKDIPHRFLLCEFWESDVLQFPVNSGIPRSKLKYLRMNGKYLYKILKGIEEDYEMPIIYCGSLESAEEEAVKIFKKFEEMYCG